MALKVLIIKDLLSARTGGTKLTLDVAKALQSIGHDVRIVFFHSDGTEGLIRDEMTNLNFEIYENPRLFRLSQLAQLPIIKVFLKDAFKPDDAVNFLSQLSFIRYLNRLPWKYDLLISMSLWTGLVSILVHSHYRKHSILYFHEPPTFGGLPLPLRILLRSYLHRIVRSVALNVSITEMMKKAIEESLGIRSAVLADAFRVKSTLKEKEDFVLADTRWTFIRDPFFLISIAKETEGVRFVMCGGFGSPSLRDDFRNAVIEAGLSDRIEMREQNSESELDSLYSRARCYIRWSSKSVDETGPGYGLIQAVSNGCIPIVSENLGSASYVRENIGEAFVVRNEPSEFASVIRRLFSDSVLQSETYGRVIEWRNSYTAKDYGNALLALYDFEEKTVTI